MESFPALPFVFQFFFFANQMKQEAYVITGTLSAATKQSGIIITGADTP
jgi:hypothetical protein